MANCATVTPLSVLVPYYADNIAETRKLWQHYKQIPSVQTLIKRVGVLGIAIYIDLISCPQYYLLC